jgi:hypothetical protein
LPPVPDVAGAGSPGNAMAAAAKQMSTASAANTGESQVESLGARIVDDGGAEHSEPSPEDVEHAAEARARLAAKHAGKRPKIRYKGAGARGLEAFALGCVLAIFVAAIHYREDVVSALPSSAGLYSAVGLPVNLRGLEFAKVTQRRDFESGVPVLIVEGEILNVRDRPTQVPALRFSLRGKSGDELYAWTLEPRQRVIETDSAMSFRTRLASPPRGADDLQLRFIERDRRIVGVTN